MSDFEGGWAALHWTHLANCRGSDPEMWFVDSPGHATVLPVHRRICGPCPVQAECLTFALRTNSEGVWAATTWAERRRMNRAIRARRNEGDAA